MKKEILMLIIGILIGAIIVTGIFLVLQNNNNNNQSVPSAPSGDMPQMDSESGNFTGSRPEKPGESNGSSMESNAVSNES